MSATAVPPASARAEGERIAASLARFAAETRFEDLSPVIVDRMRRSVLDALGVGLLGSRSEAAALLGPYALAHGAGEEASVLGGGTAAAGTAVLLNGTFIHAVELSETFNRAVVHPGNMIVPVVLAVGEREGASGVELIRACAIGYELLVRCGLSVGLPWMMEQGFHTPSALGAFGAAAAAGALIGLDAERMHHSLGIAACLSPSMLKGAFRGAGVKDLFEGYAAQAGVMAADLAARGMTGVREWPDDWHTAMVREPRREQLDAELGETWRIDSGGLRFKTRAVAAMAAPTLDAIAMLQREAPVDPAQIAAVRVESAGRVTIGASAAPPSVGAARGSVPWLTAFALTRRDEFLGDPHLVRALTPEVVADADVRALAERVELVVDPELDREFESSWPPKFAARVRVTLAAGEERVQYWDSFPSTSNLPFEAVAAKFRDIARDALPAAQAEQVVATVRELEALGDVRALGALLRAAP